MRQLTLATAGFDKHSKLTRRAAFLAEMEQVVPWRDLCAVVEPFYPKPGKRSSPPAAFHRSTVRSPAGAIYAPACSDFP